MKLTDHPPESSIVFCPAGPGKEVMRIDRNGVKVNHEYTVDEATQHVLNALSAHISHMVNQAVAKEREACAKVCEEEGLLWGQRYAAAIRARGETK